MTDAITISDAIAMKEYRSLLPILEGDNNIVASSEKIEFNGKHCVYIQATARCGIQLYFAVIIQ
ncbi:hypothetical protein GCM10007932_02120 [Vibrio penaeicida]|uniref:DUF2536 family protein n=1 Tax=Vibrio penaeicida TaxID=104609 RepID=A0AAV5NJM8_9VIBR|nr:hypothetical protein GCM10007932_02120 [Vibrio penaeicida]